MDFESDIYRRFLTHCPYNNATELFWRKNERPHQEEKFGYTCVHQSQALVHDLCDGVVGMNAHLCNGTGKQDNLSHTAVSCERWGQHRLYDPTLLATRPINISRMFLEQTADTVSVFPVMGTKYLQCLRSDSGNTIDVQLRSYFPGDADHDSSSHRIKSFEFLWKEKPPPAEFGKIYCPDSVHYPIEGLLMQWLREDGVESSILLDTSNGGMSVRNYNGVQEEILRKGGVGDIFAEEIRRIEDQRDIVRGGIFDFFERAWEIYKELHPDWKNGVPPF